MNSPARRSLCSGLAALCLLLTACAKQDAEPPDFTENSPAAYPSQGLSDGDPDIAGDRGAVRPKYPRLRANRAGEVVVRERDERRFAGYVVRAWAYSVAKNNAALLSDATATGVVCDACAVLAEELAQRKQQRWAVSAFEPEIKDVRILETELGSTARVRMSLPPTESFFADGTFRNANPPRPNVVFTVSMTAEERRLRLVGFSIDER